jgi:hypothetical protein
LGSAIANLNMLMQEKRVVYRFEIKQEIYWRQ